MPKRLRLFSYAVCLGFFFISICAVGQGCKKCGLNPCDCENLLGLINLPEVTGSKSGTDNSADNSPPGNEAQSSTSRQPVSDTLTNEPEGAVGGVGVSGNAGCEHHFITRWDSLQNESRNHSPRSQEWRKIWNEARLLATNAFGLGLLRFQLHIGIAFSRLAQYPSALEQLRRAEIIAQTLNDPKFSIMLFDCKAHVFKRLHLDGEALHCYLLAYPYYSFVTERVLKAISMTIELFQENRGNNALYFEVTHYQNWYATLRLIPEGCHPTPSSAGSAVQHPSLTSDTSGFIPEESTGSSLAQQPHRTPDDSASPERSASYFAGHPVCMINLEPVWSLIRGGWDDQAMSDLTSLRESFAHNAIPSWDIQFWLADICSRRRYYRMALFYYRSIYQWDSLVPQSVFAQISRVLESVKGWLDKLVYEDILAWQTSLHVPVETPTVFPE